MPPGLKIFTQLPLTRYCLKKVSAALPSTDWGRGRDCNLLNHGR